MYYDQFDLQYHNARQLAIASHLNQMRGSEPYVNHPLRVSTACLDIWNDPYAAVAGLLHDVIEDTPHNRETLELYDFDEEIIEVVELLSRSEVQTRKEYIDALIASENIHALRVKIMDAIDNSSWSYWDQIAHGHDGWEASRLYYRDLATKLWAHYLDHFQSEHNRDEDQTFFERVIHRWNELDNLSRRLKAGEVLDVALFQVRMLEIIRDTKYPTATTWAREI